MLTRPVQAHNTLASLESIESAVSKLSPHDLIKFRRWFQEFDASSLDEQIELDAASGKLDAVRDAALNEYHEGKAQKL